MVKTITQQTNIHLILDMSGSMISIGQKEVVGSVNEYIKEVKKTSPGALLNVIRFDTEYEPFIENEPIKTAKVTEADYAPRGMTALYDAIGKTVQNAPLGLNLFVILTDGLENASKEFTKADMLKKLIKKAEKAGHQFVFLGANQDAILSANAIGIGANNTATYTGTSAGYTGATAVAANITSTWTNSPSTQVNVKRAVHETKTGKVVSTTP